MAQLAIPLIGAAVGSAAGAGLYAAGALASFATITSIGAAAQVGAQFGLLAGSLVGGLIMAGQDEGASPPIRFPNTIAADSQYGSPIGRHYGTMRVTGQVIYGKAIEELNSSAAQGFGGGQRRTQEGYAYYGNFIVSLGAGPAVDVLRIWADSKLIYDVTGSGVGPSAPVAFRFYGGTEDQVADPMLVDEDGADACAHRGQVLLAFEHMALANYGNRYPNIAAEVNFGEETVTTVSWDSVNTSGSVLAEPSAVLIDYSREEAIFNEGATYARHAPLSDVTADARFSAYPFRAKGAGHNRMFGANGDFLSILYPYGLPAGQPYDTGEGLHQGAVTSVLAADRVHRAYFFVAPEYSRAQYFRVFFGSDGLSVANGGIGPLADSESSDGGLKAPFAAVAGSEDSGYVLCVFQHATLGIEILPVEFYATLVPHPIEDGNPLYADGEVYSPSENLREGAVILPGVFDGAAAISFTHSATKGTPNVQIERTTGDLIISLFADGVPFVFRWGALSGEILWQTEVPFLARYAVNGGSRLTNDYVYAGTITGGYPSLLRLNLQTGEVDPALDGTWNLFDDPPAGGVDPWIDNGEAQWYDGQTNTLRLLHSAGGGGTTTYVREVVIARAGQTTTAADIFGALVPLANLSPVRDVNLAAVPAVTVNGYTIADQSSIVSAMQPLLSVGQMDVVETDWAIQVVPRGGDSVADINESDCVVSDNGATITSTRAQEAELPTRVTINYINAESDYQNGAQAAKRAYRPVWSTQVTNESSVTLPIALTPDAAKQFAEKTLYSVWSERHSHALTLSQEFLELEPADVVTLTFTDGYTFRGRLGTVDLGADMSLQLSIFQESAGQYVSDASADGGSPSGEVFPNTGASELLLLDAPLLSDADSIGTGLSGLLAGASGRAGVVWPGALFYDSSDGTTYDVQGRFPSALVWGITESALPDPPSGTCMRTDRTSTLDVVILQGESSIASVTEAAMLGGSNLAALIKANGQVELIAFSVAAANGGDTRFTLSTFLRGRRGTETMAADHAVGETFILLDNAPLLAATLTTSQLNVSRMYKAVTIGTLLESASAQPFEAYGRDLMPYAPCLPLGALDGADIALSWTRRTRIGGEMAGGTGTVPLSEESEAYEVDILDGPGGAVLRTLEVTDPEATYLEADILTDFGAPVDTLDIVIYQMSEAVGRGFPCTATLEIA